MKITLDTNVLVRLATLDDPAQAAAAQAAIAKASLLAVPTVAFCELAWVLLRGYRYRHEQVAHAIRTLMQVRKVSCNAPAVLAGLALLEAGGDFADGALTFEGELLGGSEFVSFDQQATQLLKAQGRKALGWKVPQVGPWTLSFPFFIDGAKDAAEGALMAQTFIAEPSNERRAAFLASYARKFNSRRIPVPMAAANGYDASYLLLYALLSIHKGPADGPAIKAALEGRMKTYYGVVATYDHPFSPQDKEAISVNMLVMGQVRNGLITFAYPEDAKRNLIVQRKQ